MQEFGNATLFNLFVSCGVHVEHGVVPLLTQLVSQLAKQLHIRLIWELVFTINFTRQFRHVLQEFCIICIFIDLYDIEFVIIIGRPNVFSLQIFPITYTY